MATSPPERHSRFQLPSSLKLLLAPGIRGHALIFLCFLGFIFGVAYVGRALSLASTWTIVFAVGASASATYFLLAPLASLEKLRTAILFATMGRRALLLGLVYGPILAGISYWIYEVGSVESLPIFPYFIAIFYAWILSQAYFIANPISHAMMRIESGLVGKGLLKKISRTLGITALFLPIAPLTFGVWEISRWANQNYSNIAGAGTYILSWTLIVTLTLVATYLLTVMWGWKNVKNGKPQTAIFAGGTFLVVWGYLLYRAATMLMSVVTQTQPSNPLIDVGLMIISIFGAMQTFARKTVNRADRRWSQVLPFMVFSFGSVYAVAQFYFILQASLTRAGLSAVVNGTVFAVGTLTLMLLLRSHLKITSVSSTREATTSTEQADHSGQASEPSQNPHESEQAVESQFVGQSSIPQENEAGQAVQDMEESEQNLEEPSDSENQ